MESATDFGCFIVHCRTLKNSALKFYNNKIYFRTTACKCFHDCLQMLAKRTYICSFFSRQILLPIALAI